MKKNQKIKSAQSLPLHRPDTRPRGLTGLYASFESPQFAETAAGEETVSKKASDEIK